MGLHIFSLGGCAQIRWALGGENVYNMGLPSFPWEGVHKYDGQGEVYKMRRSNLRVLGHFFCAVVGSLTIVALQPRFLVHT